MAQEYNNEQIVKLFGKQMDKLGERKSEILRARVEQRTRMEQYMKQFREQNQQVQQQLDQKIESFEDRFTDTANVLEYDAARLETKYSQGKHVKKSDIPCLSERSGLARCYKNNSSEIQACNAIVEALTACATKAITTK